MLLASTNQHKSGCMLDTGEKCPVGKGVALCAVGPSVNLGTLSWNLRMASEPKATPLKPLRFRKPDSPQISSKNSQEGLW